MPNRDDFHRCPVCLQLIADETCDRDKETGAYICPNGCVKPYIQPPYEPPTNT